MTAKRSQKYQKSQTDKALWYGTRRLPLSTVGLIVTLVIGFSSRFLGEFIREITGGQNPFANFIAAIVLAVGMIAGVYVVGVVRHKITWTELGLSPGAWCWRWLPLLVGLMLMLFLIRLAISGVIFAGVALLSSPPTDPQNAPALATAAAFSIWDFLGDLLSVGMLGPFAEELLFRGVLYCWLRQRFGLWIATLVSSLFFSLLHIGALYPYVVGGVAQLINTFIIGLVYAIVYERTQSTWAVFALHALNNSNAIMLDAALTLL